MVDKIKLAVSLLLLVAGIAGFYLLEDKAATVIRVLIVIAGVVLSLLVMTTSVQGKAALVFVSESFAEAKKVVWPTRKETIQTTVAVFVLVVIMAAFLAVVDIGFAYMVQWLMGRST